MLDTQDIINFILKVVAYGGSAAAIGYQLFKYLGEKFIAAKFDEQLEDIKAKHAEALAHLKVEIDSALSGAIKVQEREFEVLPKAWRLLDNAYRLTGLVVLRLQKIPDLNQLSDRELLEFLEKSEELPQTAQEKIITGQDRTRTYWAIVVPIQLMQARQAVVELRDHIGVTGIFLTPSLKKKFQKIVALQWDAVELKERAYAPVQSNGYSPDGDHDKAWKIINDDVTPLRDEIELDIQSRLHSHGASKLKRD